MRVVYEDSIIKRIQRAVYDADVANRRIGYIEVTIREANELSEHVRRYLYVDPFGGKFMRTYTSADAGKKVGDFFGAEVRVEKLK
jgi:hypothetical protein